MCCILLCFAVAVTDGISGDQTPKGCSFLQTVMVFSHQRLQVHSFFYCKLSEDPAQQNLLPPTTHPHHTIQYIPFFAVSICWFDTEANCKFVTEAVDQASYTITHSYLSHIILICCFASLGCDYGCQCWDFFK